MEAEMVPNGTAPRQETAEAQERRSKKETPRELRFTVDRKEMLAGIGITPKILRTWEEVGLFVPQLGRGTRRFTATDVNRLRFLKHLHDDLGLSKEVMQRLYTRFFHESPSSMPLEDYLKQRARGLDGLPYDPAREYRLLDLKEIRLLSADDAFQTIVDDTLPGWNERAGRQRVLERWLIKLAHNVFHGLWSMHTSNPGVYEAARRDLLDRLKVAELTVRADVRDGEIVSYSPACSDDPEERTGPLADKIIKRHNEVFDYDEVPF